MKSIEQRLFEAFQACRGLRLSADEVDALVQRDETIRTRISNRAAEEARIEPTGHDEMRVSDTTWKVFVARMQKENT